MINQNDQSNKFLQVPSWSEFQHYGGHRSPPWIKVYHKLLSNYEFNVLPDDAKGHVMMIWLLASKTGNKLPHNAEWIKHQLHAQNNVDLDLLIKSGFLEPYDGEQSLSKLLDKT